MKDFSQTNFAKLNHIQQQIADIFQKNELTRPEVFVVLKSMRDFKMANKEIAEKYWSELKWADPYNDFGEYPFNPSKEIGEL